MRVQSVEDLDLSKITLVARVDLRDKTVRLAKTEGIRATEKMVCFDNDACKRLTHCNRKPKESVGRIGESYQFENIVFAYDEEHLETLLELITHNYIEDLTRRIVSLEDTLEEFTAVEWNTQTK